MAAAWGTFDVLTDSAITAWTNDAPAALLKVRAPSLSFMAPWAPRVLAAAQAAIAHSARSPT